MSVRVHFVWSTIGRIPLIAPAWRGRLYAHMGGVAEDLGATLIAAGGMPDHVHLLVSMPSTVPIGHVVATLKESSATWVKNSFRPRSNFAWQENYGAFSVSRSLEAQVVRYITSQEKHHRTVGFQAEFRAMLEKHGVEYDENEVWD